MGAKPAMLWVEEGLPCVREVAVWCPEGLVGGQVRPGDGSLGYFLEEMKNRYNRMGICLSKEVRLQCFLSCENCLVK
jgi:hypothetical protein